MATKKRSLSFLLAIVMILSMFTGIVPVYAAEEIGEVIQVEYPRGGGQGDLWGHPNMNYMNGWTSGTGTGFIVRSMNSYYGQVVYCIEPGVPQHTGDKLTSRGEDFWENYPDDLNDSIDPDTIKSHIGRILQYGYTGNNTTSWDMSVSADQDTLSEIIATQLLIWETVIGERDSGFEHVSAGGYDEVLDTISYNHPLRNRILSHYNRIASSVQNHDVAPSFMSRSRNGAQTYEMEWDGSQYVLELKDTNGVLSDYSFTSSASGISVKKSGNTLIITADEAPTGGVTITANKSSSRMGVVVWSDGVADNSTGQIQDNVTWGERVSDPVYAYLNIKVSYGEAKIVKHSEDGKVSGIKFNISGNGINQNVTTKSDGSISIPNLAPGTYTVSEIMEDHYEPQTPQTITVVSGRTAVVTFSNTLKRGDLEVTKSSEDGLVKGVKFHLFGTSFSGLPVDEYAVTDASGVARFENVLISGSTPYTLEEVDTATRYVIPEDQTAPILWNDVTGRSFENILKKFRVEVKKSDSETGHAQGDASLAGAKYGLYKGNDLQAVYTTDAGGSFVSDYFVCDTDWTLREISPSEGYLLDETVYKIPADAANFTVERNSLSLGVTERVIKGNIRLVKHIDMPNQNVEITQPASEDKTALVFPESDTAEAIESTDDAEIGANESFSDVSFGDAVDMEADASVTEESTETTDPEEHSDLEGTELSETESEEGKVPDTDEVPSEEEITDPELDQPVEIPEEDLEASGGEGIIEQPEENAKFVIYLASAGSYDAAKESERDVLVTDADGFAYSKDLPYGRYRVHQVEGMEGQAFAPDFTVFICENEQTYSYILNNQTFSSLIRVEKRDAETKKIIPAANIGFQVRDLSTGEIISQTVYYPTPVTITTFYTNDEGWLMLPCELRYGQYELIEVQTCYGYVLDSEPVPFTVDGTSDVVTVEKYNYAQKGVIKIQKTGEVFCSVAKTDDMYQPVYGVKGLAGAEFTITAAEDIVTLDGTIRYTKGEVVDTITSGFDGWATSKELYLGKYLITEITAPEPMVLNGEAVPVELTYAGQNVELTEVTSGVYNERQKVEISLNKALETNTIFDIGLKDEMASVSFGLYAAEEITAADGSIIPVDGLIEVLSIGENGLAVCKTDLPVGSYYLQERSTNNQYILDDTKYPVTFSYGGSDKAVIKIEVNNGDAIFNELIYGSVSGKKVDDNGKGLAGAVIGLFASDAGEFTEKTAILTTTSAEDGSFRFDDVPKGTWYLREIQQPEGFVLCDKVFPVTIEDDEQVVEIEITNKRIRGNLSLTKVDADYPDHKLSGAVFEVYRDTNGDKKLDKHDELLGVMKETETGFYEMKDIEFGGVIVREKTAPEGFYLDEGEYYISIEADGETYIVENDAGHGFINQAHLGNLKIVKTSSDGKVKGFSFRVVGEDYDQTFTTDESGVIFIEGLRVQKYTITELEDALSSDYKRPDPVTVELVTDETLTVNVHNEKITVDVPKTGDETNIWLWVGLMAVGAAGIAAAVIIPRRKKRTHKA